MSGGRMKFAVVVFPGSNCDHDALHAVGEVLGQEGSFVWHQDTDLARYDAIILPGGFSYGDYLRTGAIARFSPVMAAVEREAGRGKLVIGICNGFQILLEAGLLPGAMRRNDSLRFQCHHVYLRVENAGTAFTNRCRAGQALRVPIAHAEGNYHAEPADLARMNRKGLVIFRYATPAGEVTPEANANGSAENIAGVMNEAGNVLGLMPHPERAMEGLLGGDDGRLVFESMLAAWKEGKARVQVSPA
jgi:phosphoribosylformylglycinamidine synthase I